MFATLVIRSTRERERERACNQSSLVRSEGLAFYTVEGRLRENIFHPANYSFFCFIFFLVKIIPFEIRWDSSGVCFAIVLHEARLPVHAYTGIESRNCN